MSKVSRRSRRHCSAPDLDLYEDPDYHYWYHTDDDEGGVGGGLDPIHYDQIDHSSFQEISMRGMLQVLKKYSHHQIDLVLALDCSGNSLSALQNQHVTESIFLGVKKIIQKAHTLRRFGFMVTGASELVFPLQTLASNDNDTQQHLMAQWAALRDSALGNLSAMSIALDIGGVGRVISTRTLSFKSRTDFHRLITNNWSERSEDDSKPVRSVTREPTSTVENSLPNDNVPLDDHSLNESSYDIVQIDDDDQSWRTDGSDEWNHHSVQESWDGLSDMDSVMSLNDAQSYADMVRFGGKASSLPYVPDLGSKTARDKQLPSITEDSVSLIVNDNELQQQFVELQESIDLLLDQNVMEQAPSIDAFDAKYKRRGRKGGARPDGKCRWKRYK